MIVLLLAYLALVIIRPQDYPEYAELGIPILPVTLAAALGLWLLQGQRKNLSPPTYPLFAAFIVIAMLSAVVNGWTGGALEHLGLFLPMLIAFTMLAHAAQQPRKIGWIMVTIVLCAVVLALHGVQQAQTGEGWTGMGPSLGGRIQYVGIFSDPNDLAMLFVMAIPMAMLLSSRGGLMGLRRLFWVAAAGLLVYGVYLSDSRGAFLAVMAMGGIWVWRRAGLIVAGVMGVAGLSVLMLLPTRMQELDAGESSAFGRIDAWYEGLQMFLANPVFGVGVFNFTEHHDLTAHNSFVLTLAETGIVGFTVWLAFIGYAFVMVMAVLRHQPALADARAGQAWRDERALATTLLVSQVGFFFCAFFLSRSYIVILFLLNALVTGWYVGARMRWPTLPALSLRRDAVRWCWLALGATVGLYVIVKVLMALGS